jgi:SAM-dependent methyltransferase
VRATHATTHSYLIVTGRVASSKMVPSTGTCDVCGGGAFGHVDVLGPELIQAWGLSDEEVRYINVQQGTHCLNCNSNVRSIALARAILGWRGFKGLFNEFVCDPDQNSLRVLEINEAGTLHPYLSLLAKHRMVQYPEFDMMGLDLPSASFDLVVHSDTLEHVPDPRAALAECNRVLERRGALIFTIPIILGRLTRSRRDLTPSFHGSPDCKDPSMLVHTEFGVDAWTEVLAAGFCSCELVSLSFPSGLAIVAKKGEGLLA